MNTFNSVISVFLRLIPTMVSVFLTISFAVVAVPSFSTCPVAALGQEEVIQFESQTLTRDETELLYFAQGYALSFSNGGTCALKIILEPKAKDIAKKDLDSSVASDKATVIGMFTNVYADKTFVQSANAGWDAGSAEGRRDGMEKSAKMPWASSKDVAEKAFEEFKADGNAKTRAAVYAHAKEHGLSQEQATKIVKILGLPD